MYECNICIINFKTEKGLQKHQTVCSSKQNQKSNENDNEHVDVSIWGSGLCAFCKELIFVFPCKDGLE